MAKRKTASPKKTVPYRKRRKRLILFALLVLLATLPVYYPYIEKELAPVIGWFRGHDKNLNYPVYKSYRIRIPVKYTIHGIDVSFYQGIINWQRVKAMRQDSVHISFAYLKATEGLLRTDIYYARNLHGCRQTGMVCGAYHYFRPKSNGKWQARFFVKNISLLKGDLPPVVDVESLDGVSPDNMRKELDDFIKEVTLLTNTKPIIYSSLQFYHANLAGFYDQYALWISNFDNSKLNVGQSTNWAFWQHSNRARVSGILSPVDFDLFKGDSLAFKKMLVK